MEETKVINNRTIRFSEADWFEPNIQVVVGGSGGIGSTLTFLLGRLECEIYLYDFDIVDEPNLGSQLFRTKDLGKSKVSAIKEIVNEFSKNNNIYDMGKFTQSSPVGPIVFAGFDNMEARSLMFNKWCELDEKELFIDGRLLAEQGMIFCVTPDRIEKYKEHLFEDSEVETVPCTYKATPHCSFLITSMMVSFFTNYMSNKKLGFEARTLPFKFDFELALTNFTSID